MADFHVRDSDLQRLSESLNVASGQIDGISSTLDLEKSQVGKNKLADAIDTFIPASDSEVDTLRSTMTRILSFLGQVHVATTQVDDHLALEITDL